MPTEIADRSQIAKRLFTVAEYHRMGETGILGPEERVELIDGEIIYMTPIGYRHMNCVNRAVTLFVEAFGRKAITSPQNPVVLNNWNEPQPDFAVFKPVYHRRLPVPSDVFFVVEISDSSFRYDRNIKLPRFAADGIPEVWIEDLKEERLLVFRDPKGNRYETELVLQHGDSVSPLAFPEVTFAVTDLLGEPETDSI
jgi:Uma2 family endonuclease